MNRITFVFVVPWGKLLDKANAASTEENARADYDGTLQLALWLCLGTVYHGHKLNSTGEFRQLQVTMNNLFSLQIKQMQTKERVCSDTTVLGWVLAMDAFSSIYLELKQSILAAQGQGKNKQACLECAVKQEPSTPSGEPTSVRRVC